MKNLLTAVLFSSSILLNAQQNSLSKEPVPEKPQKPEIEQVIEVKRLDTLQDKAPDASKAKSQMQSFPTKPKVESDTEKPMLAPTNCKVSPDPTLVMQADGSQITIFGKGTMVNSWTETMDGYSVVLNANGIYEYADKINGNLVNSGIKANDPAFRTVAELGYLNSKPKSIKPNLDPLKQAVLNQVRNQVLSKSFPTTGNVKVLALLIDYPDLQKTFTKANFDSLMNGNNYRNGDGSFKMFYQTASHGQLIIDVDVYGWYRASHGYAYYGNNNGSGRAADLVREAVNAAETAGVNFALYDNNNDNAVDGILAVHAGPGAEQGSQNQYIWSHRWVLNGGTLGSVYYDGVYINDYMINPETRTSGSSQNIVGIGVICHEFGHNLGLPDLYDTDNSNGSSEGIGNWGLMGGAGWLGGEHRPGNFCAWSKIKNNWDTPTMLTIGQSGSYTIPPASTSQNQIFRINTNQNNEYFLLENRQKVGIDIELNGEGLAIWHINTSKTNGAGNGVNADENLKGVDLEEADGSKHLDNGINRGDNGDLFPGSSNNQTFDDNTNPNAKNYLNGNTGLQIRNITESGNMVSFDFGPPVTGAAPGDTMYFQDFNSTTNSLPSGWTTSNPAKPSALWKWSNSAPGGQYSATAAALNSTSSSNGYLSLPSDFYNTPTPTGGFVAMNASVTSNAISISSSASVLVRFQHSLRFCCNNSNDLVLEVSTNGTTWTTFDARGSASSANLISPNGESVEIDVTSVLGNATTAYLRFRQTGSSHYYWMIDDVAIVNGFDNALELEGWDVDFWPNFTRRPEFSMIPKNIFDPVGFTAQIRNGGSNVETGVGFRTEVFNNFSTTPIYSTSATLPGVGISNPQQVDVLNITSPLFTANYNANFTTRFTAFSNSVNQRPANATADYIFSLTDSVLAKDYGVFNAAIATNSYTGGGFVGDKLGTLFSIGQNGDLATSISVFVANNSANIGAVIQPQLYYWNNDSAAVGASIGNTLSLIGSTAQSTYTVSSIDLGTWITIPFNTAINLSGNKQYVLAYEQKGSVPLRVGRDISVQDRIMPVTNFVFVGGGWGWIDAIPGMRLNFGNVGSTISDAKILSVSDPSEYTKIPNYHHDYYTNSAWVKNVGTSNLTNVRVKYSVYRNASIFQVDSTPSIATLVVGDSIQLFANNSFNYFLKGNYQVNYEVVFSGTDANPSDNAMLSDVLEITDTTFARHDLNATNSLGITNGYGEIGTIFETRFQDTLTTVRAYFTNYNGQISNKPLSINIRDFNGVPGSILASSDTVIYSNSGSSFVDFTFNNIGGYLVLPGDTFFIGAVNRDSNISLGTTPNKYLPKTTWVQIGTSGPWQNNEDYGFFVTYVLDANFGNVKSTCIQPNANFSISFNTSCVGGTATLTNTSTNTSANTIYKWDIGNDGTIDYTSTSASHTFNTSGSKSIKLLVENGACKDSIVKSRNISPLPTADAGNNKSICIGASTTIGGSPTGPSGSTYSWSGGSSLNSTSVANPTASPTSTTTYTVTVTSSAGCTSTDQVMVTVNPIPTADAGNNKSICIGASTTIGGSPTGPSGSSYSWSGGSSLSSASAANPTASPTSTTTYTVTVTSSAGCTSTDQVIVTVNPIPTADAGNNKSICIGASTTIGGSPTGPSGSTYSWSGGSSLNSTSAANPTASPTSTTTYTVTVTSSAGCTSTDQVMVTVNPIPTADAGVDKTICNGSSVSIGGSPTGPSGSSYSWSGGSSLNSTIAANPTASPTSTTTYTVTVTSSAGCTSTDQVMVTVNPIPTADAGVDKTICNGSSVSIGGSPTGPSGSSYSWSGGSSLNSTSVANPTASPTSTTTYTVTVTSSVGCTSTDQVMVTVNSVDNSVSQSGFVLTANQVGATYQWIGCGSTPTGPISGETGRSFTPSINGDYAVIVSLGNCIDTSACIPVIGVGIEKFEKANSISIFPNPNNGNFKIDMGTYYSSTALVSIRDIQGKMIYKTNALNQVLEVNLNISAGIYFIEINSIKGNVVKKLIVN
ncbi:MAG: M6 family metalloprotease domain-containing protein [Bacteroidetes bacterium]|nr:M6 family metalloprotease domain-containing protein [Bacteroidota bacterium]